MKILIRYDLATLSPFARGNLPSKFAGKVFPVRIEHSNAYQFYQRSTKICWWCLKTLCSIHHPRTRHNKHEVIL